MKWLASVLASIALLCGASVARADVTYTTVSHPTSVSFFRDRLVWSAFDPARNGYVLMTRRGEVTAAVPVPPRGVPFDVDLGPDANGDTVAVYSRCGREPSFLPQGSSVPAWSSGRGCDVFQFNFSTGRETRVASANTARNSEFLPSIWENRVAFARVYERRKGKAGDRSYLYARPVFGARRSERLRSGPRGSARVCLTPQDGTAEVCGVPVETGPSALDLRGRRIAFAWEAREARRFACEGRPTTGVWLDTLGRRQRRIDATCTSHLQGRAIWSPTIYAGRVYYVRSLTGGDQGWAGSIRRYRISDRSRREIFHVGGQPVLWSATDARRTFYLVSSGALTACTGMPTAPPLVPLPPAVCLLNELSR